MWYLARNKNMVQPFVLHEWDEMNGMAGARGCKEKIPKIRTRLVGWLVERKFFPWHDVKCQFISFYYSKDYRDDRRTGYSRFTNDYTPPLTAFSNIHVTGIHWFVFVLFLFSLSEKYEHVSVSLYWGKKASQLLWISVLSRNSHLINCRSHERTKP